MSPAPERNPKSDAIPAASRTGPRPECSDGSCPQRAEWDDMKEKVDEIHVALMGTAKEDGYFARVRNLEERANANDERDQKRKERLAWAIGIMATPCLMGIGYGLWELVRTFQGR